jgi:dihydroorotase
MTILLKNGSTDVFIKDSVIEAVGKNIIEAADKVIDCTGLTVIPGICDMHVHMRDPGQTHKEDIFTAGEAAAAGGVTAAVCMPNTSPVIDSPELIRDIIKRSKSSKVKVYPCAAITKAIQGVELCDFDDLKKAGAVAVSDDGRPVENARLMLGAMMFAHQAGLRVISHCEDLSLSDEFPRLGENIVTTREICLAQSIDVPIHIAHVSTKEAIEDIKTAKKQNIAVTCEVTPHHFTLTEKQMLKNDADYRMNPPLRREDDVAAIVEAIRDGTIDCIASDHAPHTESEKSDPDNPPNGVIGLETLLAVTLTRLYHENSVPLSRIVELLCINPRRLLGIPGGSLEPGNPADITVFDLNEQWVVEPQRFKSKSRNSCFKAMGLKGRVKYTIVNGEVVYDGT